MPPDAGSGYASWAFIVASYLLGAIPFGLLIAKYGAGVDVRKEGSGNIGATNVARTAGKKLGLLTLFFDVAKGAAPVLLTQHVFGQPIDIVTGAGLAAVVGHIFPVYLLFRGGKGVATGLGIFLAVAWAPTLIAVAVFAIVFRLTKIVSAGSLVGAVTLVGAVAFLDGRNEVLFLSISVVVLILIRHVGNIRRILSKAEHGL